MYWAATRIITAALGLDRPRPVWPLSGWREWARKSEWYLAAVAALACGSVALADPAPYDRNSFQGEGWNPNVHLAKTARESPWHSGPTPDWTNTLGFEKDVFSFARVRWTRQTRSRQIWWNGGYWYSDYPDSDLNVS